MTPEVALELFAKAFWLTVQTVMLIVGPGLAVGLLVSVFQAATQINEQTLSFLPRLIVTLLAIMYFGPMITQNIIDLFEELMVLIPTVIG